MATQREPRIRLWLDGKERADAEDFLLELEVDVCTDTASSFRFLMDLNPIDTADGQGDWDLLERGPYLEAIGGPLIRLMTRVTIAFGLSGREGEPANFTNVFDGYVTELAPFFGENRVEESRLEVSGLDVSALMHFETVTNTWADMTDADIARSIFEKHGFAAPEASIEETAPARAQDRSVLMQRCTDAEFLRLLAKRNGFETYVELSQDAVVDEPHPGPTAIGHFHTPRAAAKDEIQPALSLGPDIAPSLIEFRARWDSYRPTATRAFRLDERSRLIERVEVTEPGWQRLGTTARVGALEPALELVAKAGPDAPAPGSASSASGNGADSLLPPNPLRAREIHTGMVPHNANELAALARGAFRRADWLVEGEGVVRGERYETIVRARRPIRLEGAGRLLNGTWYCRSARHRWARDQDTAPAEQSEQVTRRYEVDVVLVRNGLGPDAQPEDTGAGAAP